MNDKKMCMYVFESGFLCGTTASVLGNDNKWYCKGHARTEIKENIKRSYGKHEKITLICMVCKNELAVFPVIGTSQEVAPCEYCAK